MKMNFTLKHGLLFAFIIQLSTFTAFGQWKKVGATLTGINNSTERFGRAVSISADGSILAIGVPRAGDEVMNASGFTELDEKGEVRIYSKNTSNEWIQDATIKGTAEEQFFGRALELTADGTTLIVGGPEDINSTAAIDKKGIAKVYKKNTTNGNWEQIGSDIVGENNNEYAGWSVSIADDGNTIALGAWGANSETGTARIYTKNASNQWIKQADLTGTDAGDRTGYDVSLSNDGAFVAVGAYEHDGGKGTTRIYSSATNWSQVGSDIDGETSSEKSGFSVSIDADGNTVAIGAYDYNSGDGTARIYENQSGTWTKTEQIDGTASDGEDFGYEVYLTPNANTIVIGGRAFDWSNGVTRVYKNEASVWNQIGDDIESGASTFDFVFSSTALSLTDDGETVAVGAYAYNSSGGFTNDGVVQIYNFDTAGLSIEDIVATGIDADYTIENGQVTINNQDLALSIFDLTGRQQYNNSLKGIYVLAFTNVKSSKTTVSKVLIP